MLTKRETSELRAKLHVAMQQTAVTVRLIGTSAFKDAQVEQRKAWEDVDKYITEIGAWKYPNA